MAQRLPPDASRDTIEEELEVLEVMVDSLDQGADNYASRLAELEELRTDYQKRLDNMDNGAEDGAGQVSMGLDGNNDFWEATMGGRPDSTDHVSAGSAGSFAMPQNGLKRSLNGISKDYPSKRPTPDPSNAGTPTSSTGSFEWIEHPHKPTQPSQYSSDKARERQLRAEAVAKRQREEMLADEQYARKLSQSQSQPRSASASSSRPNVQTTLNHNGSFSRPKPSPVPLLSPDHEENLRSAMRPHGHPTPVVKAEPGSSKQPQQLQHYSSPLTTRTKPAKNVVDLTGSDSDEDDVTEVAPTAFSPNSRRAPPLLAGTYASRQPSGLTRPSRTPKPGQYPMQPARQQMPGAWPGAVEVPSNDNGYVYSHNRPSWLNNSSPLTYSQPAPLIPTPYSGVTAIGGSVEDQMDRMRGLNAFGGPSNSRSSHGGTPSGMNPYRGPVPAVPQVDRWGRPVGGHVGRHEDDEDDDIIFGGSRPRAPGQPFGQLPGGLPAGYTNTEHYRRNYDEIMRQDPEKTMEEINALMENIRPDEDTPAHLRVKTPVELSVELHKYQELGLTWLQRCENGTPKGGILADDMGLGKTIQMLSLIVTRKSDDPRCKTTLIVAPVALMRQWKQEIESKLKLRHRITVHIHHGQSRKKNFSDLRHFDVVLTTFGTLTAELKKVESFALRKRIDPAAQPRPNEKCALLGPDARWYRVVLDEAQCIKNNNTQGAKAACRLNAQYRFCMTGTPMMNNVDELWSLIHFLRIKPYSDRHHFQRDFTKKLKSEHTRQDAMTHLQALIRSIMLRRTKQSKFEGRPILVLPERTTLVDNPVFSDDERDFYKALESKSQLQVNRYLRDGTVGNSYSAILVLLLRLRQACCHPHLIKDFGVSAAAGVSPDTLIELAQKLSPDVVDRIKSTNGNFECPVCYDAVTNPAIFVPCGHDTCQECFAKIADNAARNGDGGGVAGNAKCPNCRGEINAKKITDFESFKKVHMPDMLTEEEQAELQKMQEEFGDSETDSDDDSEDDSGDEDEINSNGDLDDFIVADDADVAEDTETESEAGGRVKPEEESEDDVVGPSRKARATKAKDKGKGRAKEKASVKKAKKSKATNGKKKGKAEKKKDKPIRTLAELKKKATRSAKGRLAYIKKLDKDWVTSAKLEKTMETLKEIMENPEGEKVLIFSQWTSLLDLLECPIYREGWDYRRYDGSMNAGMRADAVDDFRDTRKDVRIMLVSLKAGNAGLNLNMASQVIILDPFWNPYIEEQAIDRAHRIGQTRPVTVHRMLIEGTVEDRIIALQEKKRQLISDALDEKASQSIARLGVRELRYLFGITQRA